MWKKMIAGMLLAQSMAAWTQTNVPGTPPREPVISGAIIMPPKDDPAAAKKPAEKTSGAEAVPRPRAKKKENKAKQSASNAKGSKDATCKGPAELCKQTSPR
jgi:hypothetical protein